MKLASLEKFRNKVFVATSGNICQFEIVGPGGLGCRWYSKPSEKDISEVQDFMSRILPPDTVDLGGKVFNDKEESFEFYKKFLEKNKED